MARSVTGAMRAVKVVWRSDYDYDEAFEREFEAIKRYEPVSRRHPGLVPVLQVGRNDDAGFYYYVMELADDIDSGRDIRSEGYKPKTLTAWMRKNGRIKAAECLKVGETIAEGLHFMHQNGLIHRDVKPSNLVFIDGVCRLADIGLVALLGQRSFVGTEGFVAPEGPGSAQSDIFSLGMVLYEASTGKDRLDFPDLPAADETGVGLENWRLLHQVICRACAQHAQDRYESAQDMALALRGEKVPERGAARKRLLLFSSIVAALLLVGGLWYWNNHAGPVTASLHRSTPLLTFKTTPEGADVYSNGQKLGVTPLSIEPPVGVPVIYQLRLAGYRVKELENIANRSNPTTYDLDLEKSLLPQPGERWTNNLKMPFLPRQTGHTSEAPVEMKFFDAFIKNSGRPFEGRVVPYLIRGEKKQIYIVVVPPADAEAFRAWLTESDRDQGYLTTEHHYELEPIPYVEGDDVEMAGPESPPPPQREDSSQWQAFSLRVERQGYGSVLVRSNPAGASVFQRDELLGITPLELPLVKTGDVEYELRGEGFTDMILEGNVVENEMLDLYGDMDMRRSVNFGREWKNSLGLRFLPLGDVLMCATETRRRDYNEYVKDTNARRPMPIPDEKKQGVYPVIGVDREEARAFCAWLTERERRLGLIGPQDTYRLPTDEEWSRAVGLPLERGKDPEERSGRIRGVYPWGYDWPPPRGVDNLADESYARKHDQKAYIARYEDRFPSLAPVGAMHAGPKGFIGLAGNVSEWVDNDYRLKDATRGYGPAILGTLRGGNWRTSNPEELLSSARLPMSANTRRDSIGFRLVLAKG